MSRPTNNGSFLIIVVGQHNHSFIVVIGILVKNINDKEAWMSMWKIEENSKLGKKNKWLLVNPTKENYSYSEYKD